MECALRGYGTYVQRHLLVYLQRSTFYLLLLNFCRKNIEEF